MCHCFWPHPRLPFLMQYGEMSHIKRVIKLRSFQIKVWCTDVKGKFSAEESQMENKHVKKCSASLAIKSFAN